MREKERIQRIMNKIETIWKTYPDTRFFQLVSFLESKYCENNGDSWRKDLYEKEVIEKFKVESYRQVSVIDLFHLEDDKFENFLDNYINQHLPVK